MISVENHGDETRITIHGDLDDLNAPQLRTLFTSAASGRERIAVDLTDCTFIHSAGISLLATLVSHSGAPCRIVVDASGIVRRVLEHCGFGERLTIGPDHSGKTLSA